MIGRVVDRKRQLHNVAGNPALQIQRRENDTITIFDPATDSTIELLGYGRDNVAAFAGLLD